jgi:hypothetical protein
MFVSTKDWADGRSVPGRAALDTSRWVRRRGRHRTRARLQRAAAGADHPGCPVHSRGIPALCRADGAAAPRATPLPPAWPSPGRAPVDRDLRSSRLRRSASRKLRSVRTGWRLRRAGPCRMICVHPRLGYGRQRAGILNGDAKPNSQESPGPFSSPICDGRFGIPAGGNV